MSEFFVGYEAVSEQVLWTLLSLIDPMHEVITTDFDNYEWFSRLYAEPTKDQLYPATSAAPAGGCFRGENGDTVMQLALDSFAKRGLSADLISAYKQQYQDTIIYDIHGLTQLVLMTSQSDQIDITEELIFRMLIIIIAHERRHATQPPMAISDLLTDTTSLTSLEYILHPLEVDASMFSCGVSTGRLRMNEVATWQPTAEKVASFKERFRQQMA